MCAYARVRLSPTAATRSRVLGICVIIKNPTELQPSLADHFAELSSTCCYASNFLSTFRMYQGWVIQRRHIIRRIVFITYISVFFELLRIIRFSALNEFCSHKPPRAPQKHSQALKNPTEALPSPLEPPEELPAPQNVA